ncbi:Hypothetical Protein SLY_0879 [Strawberry lethal yellows phytoplasma (CPA) str. NZSb11]|uniref:Uncharacterized protein n=1 Tax=Strawberry lethal yellows phytoplasma (CPA) str. NZSb11 TaxID=980422 RepID=R4S1U6_PHYAS|nr:Hypothetical Protein SLY_0879 [Strawberry lethal yellows phytoplasma (CPA) str. NZSb11]
MIQKVINFFNSYPILKNLSIFLCFAKFRDM